MSDTELRTAVEQGRVPLCITMADSDMFVAGSANSPKPVFVHALRATYLPVLVLASAQDMAAINGATNATATPLVSTGADAQSGCILYKFAVFAPTSGSTAAGGVDSLLANVWFDVAGIPVKWFAMPCPPRHTPIFASFVWCFLTGSFSRSHPPFPFTTRGDTTTGTCPLGCCTTTSCTRRAWRRHRGRR